MAYFCVQAEGAGYGWPQVGERVNHVETAVVEEDVRGWVDILGHGVCLLQADGKPEVFACVGRTVESRYSSASVCEVSSASSANSNSCMRTTLAFVLEPKRAMLKSFPSARPGAEPGRCPRCNYQRHTGWAWRRTSGWCQGTTLLHSTADWEGVWGCTVEAVCAVHILMERGDDAVQHRLLFSTAATPGRRTYARH